VSIDTPRPEILSSAGFTQHHLLKFPCRGALSSSSTMISRDRPAVNGLRHAVLPAPFAIVRADHMEYANAVPAEV